MKIEYDIDNSALHEWSINSGHSFIIYSQICAKTINLGNIMMSL